MALRDHLPAIVACYRAGDTLESIAHGYGVSRERVRQLVVLAGEQGRRGGVSVGGNVVGAEARAAARFLRNFGCDAPTVAEFNDLRPISEDGSLAQKYSAQRHSAKNRGIEWRITFPEWVRAWRDSGHLDNRGRPGYCMARFGDTGPYAVGNIYFTTIGGNVSDYFAARRAATD